MIRANNIDGVAKTCDFYMDGKDAYVIGYDITSLSYNEDNTGIVVPGTILTQGVDAGTAEVNGTLSIYPVQGGNELAQALAAAKA